MLDRNEISLKILCSMIAAENYTGQLDEKKTIESAYVWADAFIEKSTNRTLDEIAREGY